MKKSLIALAVLAASGAAMAQSSVNLFGVLDTSVAHVQGGGQSNYGLLNNGIATSRLGFRGVEDLGNGLKAQFWLEGAVQPDNGEGVSGGAFNFQRRSSLSLLGSFGEVRVGRFLTAGHDKVSSYSVMSTIGVAGFQGWGAEAVRYNNMVAYYSPNFAGFTFGVNYAFDEQTGATQAGRYVGADVTYANGPVSITVAADQAQDVAAAGVYTRAAEELRSYAVGTSYDFGTFKLSGLVRQAQNKVEGQADVKFTSYALGATAPVGAAGLVKAQYAHYKLNAADAKANQFSLGYEHNLSKRTAVYGTYSYLKNDKAGQWSVQGLDAVGQADKSSQGVQVGIRHAF